MTIPFEIPAQFLPMVNAGEVVRYGALLRDAETGRFVGHLKEAGKLGETLAALPVSPISSAVKIGSAISQHVQLANIQQVLNSLQLLSSVGAFASVAGLGVCVAGFAIMNHKLNRIDAKLDKVLGELAYVRQAVNELGFKWDTITMARMKSAIEAFSTAEATTKASQREQELLSSISTFRELRNYYLQLFNHADPFNRHDFPLHAGMEMFGRYTACCVAELEGEFLLNDANRFKVSHEKIMKEIDSEKVFNAQLIHRNRHDSAIREGIEFDLEQLDDRAVNLIKEVVVNGKESIARLETFSAEMDYITANGLDPIEYKREIRELEDGIILLPVAA